MISNQKKEDDGLRFSCC